MINNSFHNKLIELQGNLYNFALRLTCNKEDASDLLQETSLKVLDSESKYTETENFKGWSFTIMRNLFINNYRKIIKDREDGALIPIEFKQDCIMSKESPENLLSLKEINNIINGFSKELHIPISMYMAGYSYHLFADALNIPLGTVQSILFLIRKILQIKLKDFR
ncbi:MAG: sigma-70 family RNA polymerase sigma factor [Muribaculaceae bacterium]